MKLILPHVGAPHPDTLAAVSRWPDLELCDLSADPEYGYGRLLRRLWREAEDFLIVEHDIVPSSAQLHEMALCPHPYCAAPYRWGQAVGVALGFTRFRSVFLRTYPDAAEIACRIPSNFGAAGHYRQLDVWLQAAVLRDLYGWQPHVHLPAVEHRNWEETPADAPLRTRVEGRCYLAAGLVEGVAAEVREASERRGAIQDRAVRFGSSEGRTRTLVAASRARCPTS